MQFASEETRGIRAITRAIPLQSSRSCYAPRARSRLEGPSSLENRNLYFRQFLVAFVANERTQEISCDLFQASEFISWCTVAFEKCQ